MQNRLNGPDLTRLLDRRDRRSHDSALQSTPCRFAPVGRIPSPLGEGGFGIGQTWAIPKTDEGKCHKFSRGFPSSVSGSFLAAASFPPRGSYGTFGAGAKSAHKAYGFSSGLCALTWRFSAGTSLGFGQPQHAVRMRKIQTCSSRSPP